MTEREWAEKSWSALASAYDPSTRFSGVTRKVYERWLRRFGEQTVMRRRRQRIRKNGGRHTQEDVVRTLESQQGLCACCKRDVRSGFEVDHVVPISKGGSDGPENLQILCSRCNKLKGATIIDINQLRESVTRVTEVA